MTRGLEAGLFTSVDLVHAYIDRIKEVNSTLHAVTELNPDAVTIAQQLDTERGNGVVLGPLHGIPILIKNNIATHDKMNNTAGSFALLGAKVPRDSTLAAKLRKAGAVILGKTNLSEWANYRSDNSSNGWSAHGGQTYAAYYPKQDPSGSSSGSGVAASIGLALAALGSETDGSILSPSDVNNLVGIKPTVGLTSRYLVIPVSSTQDTVGPMARSVKDAAALLQAIAGPDPRDNYTLANPHDPQPDYLAACNFNGLHGKKFGVPWNVIEMYADNTSAPVLRAFESSLATIRAAGARIVDANFTQLDAYSKSNNESIVLDTDFISDLAAYLSQLTYNPHKVTSLASVAAFTEHFKAEAYPSRDIAIWQRALALGYNASDVRAYEARKADHFLGGPGGVLGALERGKLDAVLLPTQFAPGFAAIVGTPAITVPMGFYPVNTSVVMNTRGNLVAQGPNIP